MLHAVLELFTNVSTPCACPADASATPYVIVRLSRVQDALSGTVVGVGVGVGVAVLVAVDVGVGLAEGPAGPPQPASRMRAANEVARSAARVMRDTVLLEVRIAH